VFHRTSVVGQLAAFGGGRYQHRLAATGRLRRDDGHCILDRRNRDELRRVLGLAFVISENQVREKHAAAKIQLGGLSLHFIANGGAVPAAGESNP